MRKLLLTALCVMGFITGTLTSGAKDFNLFGKDNEKTTIVSREYNDISDFTALSASTGFDVEYTVGPKAKVIVEVPERLLEYVIVRVADGQLSIGIKNKGLKQKNVKELRAIVTGPVLSKVSTSSSADIDILSPMTDAGGTLTVSASSSGDINFHKPLKYNVVEIASSSSADINIEQLTARGVSIVASSSSAVDIESLTADEVTVSASSSSDIELAGTAKNVTLSASSSADISAGNLRAASGSASASSSGEIVCNITSLTSKATTSGSVRNKK